LERTIGIDTINCGVFGQSTLVSTAFALFEDRKSCVSQSEDELRNTVKTRIGGKLVLIQKRQMTLADVANAAGVSKMTASRALRGDKNVSPASQEKVHKAANELGYAGNHLAASLSSKGSDLIGVVLPSFANVVFAEASSGITDALAGKRTQPVFGVTFYDPVREYEIVRNMLSWRPLGLIVTGVEQDQRTRDLLAGAEIPVVQIMDAEADPVDASVGLSHFDAGYDMAKALLDLGRHRFGFLGRNLHRDHRSAKRKAGFRRALQESGLDYTAEFEEEGLTTVEAGRQMTKTLLDRSPDLDCLYFASDDLALGGLGYCMDAGLQVPDQMALVGFNGLDHIKAFPGRIATSHTSRHLIGKRAAEIILDAIEDPDRQRGRKEIIPPKIDLGLLAKLK